MVRRFSNCTSGPILSTSRDFNLLSDGESPRLIGSVNRNFAGFGREIFTDTGTTPLKPIYPLRINLTSPQVSMPSGWTLLASPQNPNT